MNPLVSVIVPVYNGARYIAEALGSVVAQAYRPVEIIAIDDGSTDGSAVIVQAFPEVMYIRQDNAGTAAARNAGIAASTGEFIAFLDQDDRWTADKLSVQMSFMMDRPELGYTLAAERLFMEAGAEIPVWLRPELAERDHTGWLPGTLVARREVFSTVGIFDTAYSSSSDSDWFFRAKDAGVPMAALADVLLEKRIHAANQSGDTGLSLDLLRQVRASLKRKQERPNE